MKFNWKNAQVFEKPYNHFIIENFCEIPTFPELELYQRENSVTLGRAAIKTLPYLEGAAKDFFEYLLSEDFYNNVCDLLQIPQMKEQTYGIRKSEGNYRISREAMLVENTYTEEPILPIHTDHNVTIWTGMLYNVNSDQGMYRIFDKDFNLIKEIKPRIGTLVVTLNSSNTWHDVTNWTEPFNRRAIYLTSEFKNFGRDENRNAIGAKELWWT
jgi:hypothetical protein